MLPAGLAAKPASKAASSTANEQTAAQLLEFLGGGKEDKNAWQGTSRLNRPWVGTMKTVIANGRYKDDQDIAKDEPVRFEAFDSSTKRRGQKQGIPALMAALRYGFTNVTKYRRTLPSNEDLQNQDKLPGILQSFGESQSWISIWGDMDGKLHWMECWVWFTPMEDSRLRVLRIAASFVEQNGKPKKLDALSVREGFFRPSDPADPKDARDFPSEEENEAKRQAVIDAEDDALPEPLRSYLRANHAPGGSDRMDIWFAAIRKFRDKPDGILLKQIVARLDEAESTGGISIEIPMMFETLFHDSTFEKKIGGWKAKKRQQAGALLLHALPEADSDESLKKAVELALRETGVGSIKISSNDLEVDMSSRYAKNGSATGSESSFTLKTPNVRRAGEILRDEILGRWKKGKRSD